MGGIIAHWASARHHCDDDESRAAAQRAAAAARLVVGIESGRTEVPDEMEPAVVPPTTERAHAIDAAHPAHPSPASRRSPIVQTVISTALLLSTLALFFGYWQILSAVDPHASVAVALAFTPTYGAYFVAVVWLLVRHRARRRSAVIVAASVALLDTAYTAYELSPGAVTSEALSSCIYTLILTLYVAAWGLARRQHRNWVNGLPIALLLAGVCQIGITPNLDPNWIVFWSLYVGAFAVGAVICWALDVKARNDEARETSRLLA